MAIERPILFSSDMVRAILDGRKTQTRRVQKLGVYANNPYGDVGGLLWVRETFGVCGCDGCRAPPPMPRWASRITLEITGVRAQKIKECSEDDAKAEGAPKGGHSHVFGLEETYRGGFATRWDNLNKKRGFGWEANPWVWAISFKVLKAGQP